MLASKSQPTVLYEAPSHLWLRTSCFGAGIFCVSYTVVQYWSIYLHPPPGLGWWVPHAYGVVCMFMAGMGFWFATGAGGIVRRIRAMPATAEAVVKATKGTSVVASARPPLLVEVSTSRALPFVPDKRVCVPPSEITLPFRVSGLMAEWQAKGNPPRQSAMQRLKAKREEAELKEKKRKYEMDHLMTAPFRHAGSAMSSMWEGVKRGLSREGFVKIRVKGIQYKFDVTAGWALDNGKAIDRIVHTTR